MPLTISLTASGNLSLDFPTHSVTIPLSPTGLECLRRVLVAQRFGVRTTIATPASPTQWDIDRWLREHKPRPSIDLDIELDI